MRIYHKHLPWYIDIVAERQRGYISLAMFFVQLHAALDKLIAQQDYYNGHIDDQDRTVLSKAYFDRLTRRREVSKRNGRGKRDHHGGDTVATGGDKREGVRRVDFLRGEVMFLGMARGKQGMWRLRTGKPQEMPSQLAGARPAR